MKNPAIRYAAFLRGINVGGNKKVPMADLKKVLEKHGFRNVLTLLASGNVLFDADEKNAAMLKKTFETVFEKKFGFTSSVILRSAADLAALAVSDPFKGIAVTPDTRLYVTFLSAKPTSGLKIPYVSPNKDFSILRVTDTEIISVLQISPTTDTTKVMTILEKEYGKDVTTRNWNTVQKMLAAGENH